MKLSAQEFKMYRNEYAGYCRHCDNITNDCGVEPDAQRYKCIDCGKLKVMGVEDAMIWGFIQIEGDE